MSNEEFRTLALSFQGVEEGPHFDRRAFKIIGKRIFASLHEPSVSANLALSPADQKVFCQFDKKIIYPIPNKWGQKGWTTFELKNIKKELMLDALDSAYQYALKPAKK